MSSSQLTPCLAAFFKTDEKLDEVVKRFPVLKLQVLKAKDLPGPDGVVVKVRVTVSDGEYLTQAIVNVVNGGDIASNFPQGMILEINEFDAHMMAASKLVLVIRVYKKLETTETIGNPLPVTECVKDSDTESDVLRPGNMIVVEGQRQQQQQQQQQPSKLSNTSTVQSRSRAPPPSGYAAILPIEGLSPYHNTWTIRARVTNKSDIRHWQNQRGEGKLFNCTLVDESGEIRATGFTEQVDAFYDLLKEGQVYYISKCRVSIAKKQFSNVQNDFELMFERDTSIELCNDQVDLPKVKYNFTSISNLSLAENSSTVDLIGILKNISNVEQIVSKNTARPFEKRDVSIVDDTNYSIKCTFWGKQASDFNIPLESVVALKGAKISDYNGRNLSVLSSTGVSIDPDIPEAHSLKGWYDGKGRNESFNGLQAPAGADGSNSRNDDDRKNIDDVLTEQLGMSEKTEYFTTRATITYIKKENLTYPACAQPDCTKKVIQDTSGDWRCERCNVSMAQPKHRYILSIVISDHTGNIWVSGFDDVGSLLLSKTAGEIVLLQEEDPEAFTEVLNNGLFKEYVFRIRARMDTFNDQTGVRYQIFRAVPVDFVAESANILKQLAI